MSFTAARGIIGDGFHIGRTVTADNADAFAVDIFGCRQVAFKFGDHIAVSNILAGQKNDVDDFIFQQRQRYIVLFGGVIGGAHGVDRIAAIAEDQFDGFQERLVAGGWVSFIGFGAKDLWPPSSC